MAGLFAVKKNTDSFNGAEREHLLLTGALLNAHAVMCMHAVCFCVDSANRIQAVNQMSFPQFLSLLVRVWRRCITAQYEQRLCNYPNRRWRASVKSFLVTCAADRETIEK